MVWVRPSTGSVTAILMQELPKHDEMKPSACVIVLTLLFLNDVLTALALHVGLKRTPMVLVHTGTKANDHNCTHTHTQAGPRLEASRGGTSRPQGWRRGLLHGRSRVRPVVSTVVTSDATCDSSAASSPTDQCGSSSSCSNEGHDRPKGECRQHIQLFVPLSPIAVARGFGIGASSEVISRGLSTVACLLTPSGQLSPSLL